MRQIISPLDGFRSPFGARRGGSSPSALFALAEPGVWYDPSDLTTLFTDTAGTTPVTTPGQTVALALDKSAGLALGSEVWTNSGVFGISSTIAANGSGWNVTATGTSFVGIRLNTASLGTSSYRATVSWSGNVNGRTIVIFVGGGSVTLGTAVSGSTTVLVASAGSSTSIQMYATTASVSDTFTFTVSSVRELPGFHATQATAASRPTYSIVPRTGRRNLLTFTETPNALTGVTVTNNAAAGPSGRTNANRIAKTDATTPRYVSLPSLMTVLPTTTYTASAYVKYDGFDTTFSLEYNNTANWGGIGWIALFNVTSAGVATGTASLCTSSVTDVGSGWYRCTATFTTGSPVTTPTNPFILQRITGASGVTLLATEAQLETGSTATAYQRVGSAFDVTEAGVASLSYLSFDGVDDFLQTPTITPGTDKAQVFAGVRKLSDAAGAVLVEHSAAVVSNAGAFAIFAPSSAAPNYLFRSRGSATQVGADYTNALVAAPITNVLSGIGDISGDIATLRVNSIQVAQSTADQGTGNYLAYPIYIGRRGGTANPFNGNLFSLIVRFGTNLDAGTITSTETWVAGKTGVTL